MRYRDMSDIVHGERGFRFFGKEVATDVSEDHGVDELDTIYRATADARLARRIQAVWLARRGLTCPRIIQAVGVSRRTVLPRAVATLAGVLRVGGAGERTHDYPVRPWQQPRASASADSQGGRSGALAEVVAEPPVNAANRTGGGVDVARGLRLARQQPARGDEALPASDRRALRASSESAAESGAAGARKGSHGVATRRRARRENRVLRVSAKECDWMRSAGRCPTGRYRT
ncbi:MAG: helix-turn-helix domain-containing protein [Planctomycetes bacterium]|nr:helix-turn-helix domain-containing protein [Planctomycetota bacterium]